MAVHRVDLPWRQRHLDRTGSRRAIDSADFRAFNSPADRFNFGPNNFLQIPLERIGLFGNLRYEFSNGVNLSMKALWIPQRLHRQIDAVREFVAQIAEQADPLKRDLKEVVGPEIEPVGGTVERAEIGRSRWARREPVRSRSALPPRKIDPV